MKWLEFFKNPAHIGPLQTPHSSGRAGGGCGDRVEMQLGFTGEIVTESAFLANGCPAAIAGAAACADLVIGRTLLGAASLTLDDIKGLLEDSPPERERCLYLSITALASAVESHVSSGKVSLAPGKRVAVAMSGGVDSSATAFALLELNHQLVGLTQRLHDFGRPGEKSCCTPADIDDARQVAAAGGFPHLTIDMRDQFKQNVITNFCRAYIAGRTPNPCVECNRKLRFTGLIDTAIQLGAAKLATGHYVRVSGPDANGRFSVRRAVDRKKDQSYMFWSADQLVLSRLIMPLGTLHKDDVRTLAQSHDLPVANKSDSQDVCFVPDGDYAGFVRKETGFTPESGPILDSHGRNLGRHNGLIHYTVGQRRGIGIAHTEPLYVISLDTARNALVVGGQSELGISNLSVSQTNFIDDLGGRDSFSAEVMMRYNGDLDAATVHRISDDKAEVEFARPSGPVAPGQSAVFYDGETVLGGGIID